MQKRFVTCAARLALAAAFLVGLASRASAEAIVLSNVNVVVDPLSRFATVSAGFEAHSDSGLDISLDGLDVSLSQDGVPIPDLSTGPVVLDESPFFVNAPLSMADGSVFPSIDLFTLTGLTQGSTYTGSFSIIEMIGGMPQPLEIPPQTFAFTVGASQNVPEPGSVWLLGTGVALLAGRLRRRR